MKRMNTFRGVIVVIPFILNATCFAQSGELPQDSLITDSVSLLPEAPASDSLKLTEMQEQLEEARLTEMNLRMEMEGWRMASFMEDSLKREEQRRRIDSLRQITTGFPVTVGNDTLFTVYAKRGGLHPQGRALNVMQAVESLGRRFSVHADSVYVESTDITTDVMYEDIVLASFTDQDALWENTTRDGLAEARRLIIIEKVKQLQKEFGLLQLIKRIALFVLIVVAQISLIVLTNWLYRKSVRRIARLKDTKLKAITVSNYEFLDTAKQVRLMSFGANVFRYLLIAIQLIISIPLLFSIFPQTQDLAERIFSYIWDPVRKMYHDVVDYIPNLFTVIIIWLAFRYLVKGLRYISKEIANENLKIRGFYPDWALPTFMIIRFLLYAFMIAMMYGYLPGAKSESFKGVSVFVGLIVSLGSTSVIGNLMAGLVMTYMRPFKIGDRIKLNDILGNVMEKTPFVTRIKTIKNEIVTVPNSFILNSHTINYSASARDYGLIIHSEISFGYDVPWEKVKEMLVEAAVMTEGVSADPAPFVHELSFEDFYPVYQINAYISEADQTARIKSDLNRNIQELANREGIELLAPHFIVTRDGAKNTASPKNKSGQ